MDGRSARRAVAAAVAFLFLPLGASAKPAPVRVLTATTVSDAAKGSMSPAVWQRLVYAYINAEPVPFAGAVPTLADCRAVKAAYMVSASFEMLPQLPGVARPKDRLAARSRVVATNCISGNVTFDQVIPLESNPLAVANEGDLEPVAEVRWEKSVAATLARNPLVLGRIARVARVESPFCYIEFPIGANVAPGMLFRVFADKDNAKRAPIILNISELSGKYAQCIFDAANSGTPNVGDLVEPYDPAQK